MTIPPRAVEWVTGPERCPVPDRDTGTMVQALVNCSRQIRRPAAGRPLNSRRRIGTCGKPRTDAPSARRSIAPQVAAGIINSLNDPYPLRPQRLLMVSLSTKRQLFV